VLFRSLWHHPIPIINISNLNQAMKFLSIVATVIVSSVFTTEGFVPQHQALHRASKTRVYADVAVEAEVAAGVGAEAISALTKSVKTVFSLEDINKILPHRYPFLLVDKVVEYEKGKKI